MIINKNILFIIIFSVFALFLFGGFFFLYQKGFLAKEFLLASLKGGRMMVLSEKDFDSLQNQIFSFEEKLKEQKNNLEILDDLVEESDLLNQKLNKLEDKILNLKEILSKELNERLEILLEKKKERQTEKNEQSTKEEEILCDISLNENPLRNKVIINEVAWMGGLERSEAEWIELKNLSNKEISLKGWQLQDKNQQIKIIFREEDKILANGFYLLERNDDQSVFNIKADKIYTGALSNQNEALYLFDENCQLQDLVRADSSWPAGDNSSKRTMERKDDFNWQTSFNPGGTPKKENSIGYTPSLNFGNSGNISSGISRDESTSSAISPQIAVSFPSENPVNKEIEVQVSVSNLKKDVKYDIKVSIEKEGVLSDIFNEKKQEWQNSYNYLTEYFSGDNFNGKFQLRIKPEKQDFKGEAEILVRIRESGKGVYYTQSDKIKILAPLVPIFKLGIQIKGEGTTNPEPGEHSCQEGQEIKILAFPNEGWIFEKWTGDVESQGVEIGLICGEKDKIIIANFIKKQEVGGDEEESQEKNDNLLKNSSFEEEGDNPSCALYWSQGSRTFRTQEISHTGLSSIKLEQIIKNYSSLRQLVSNNVDIVSDKKYILSGWYYLKNPGNNAKPEDYSLFLRVQWDGNPGSQSPSSGIKATKFDEWVFVEFRDLFKEGASFANVIITAKRENEIPTDVYWDDISLRSQ